MFEALERLGDEGSDCCRFYSIITSAAAEQQSSSDAATQSLSLDDASVLKPLALLNDSQMNAVRYSVISPLTLIWGPPGTSQLHCELP